jgi:ABC-type dipeptide/oligopeptide/nickel transport system permease subunit
MVAILLIFLFAVQLNLLPATGWVPFAEDPVANLRSFVLPALTLAIAEWPVLMRVLRSDMIATLQEDYIAMAKAKGLRPARILLVHALKPSSLTLVTVTGINIGRLIGGALIVETIFALPASAACWSARSTPATSSSCRASCCSSRSASWSSTSSSTCSTPCSIRGSAMAALDVGVDTAAVTPVRRHGASAGCSSRRWLDRRGGARRHLRRLLPIPSPTDIDMLGKRALPSAEHWLGNDQLGRDVLLAPDLWRPHLAHGRPAGAGDRRHDRRRARHAGGLLSAAGSRPSSSAASTCCWPSRRWSSRWPSRPISASRSSTSPW